MRTIFFFVKVFENTKYMEDFLDGKLFMNTLAYFRTVEDNEDANRGDKYEAVIGWHQPSQISIKINDYEIKDLASPVCIQMSHHEKINLFCLYAAHSGDFDSVTKETLHLLEEQMRIHEDCEKLGSHAVIVTNASLFIERVRDAVQEKGFQGSAGLVEYYDPDIFSGQFSDRDSIFRKRREYSHQSEYRFALKAENEDVGPIILDVGTLRDIAHPCDVSDINNNLELRLPGNE